MTIAPRGLIGAAFVLWGVSTAHPAIGVAAAIGYEALRFRPGAAEPVRRQVLVVRTSLFAAMALLAYTVATTRFPEALYLWLRWVPLALAPLAILQARAGGTLTWSVIVAALRPGSTREVPRGGADASYLLLVALIIGAGTGSALERWFYPAVAALVAWALAAHLPRARLLAASLAFVAAAFIGFGVHNGLSVLQGKVEEWSEELFTDLLSGKQDPYRERTRIGELGRIKMNDRILMRVVTEGPRPPSILLREAAFDQYRNGEWRLSSRTLTPLAREGERWVVRDGAGSARLTVRRTLPGGEGLLALPAGTTAIGGFQAASVERSAAGAVRARGTTRFVSTTAAYDAASETGTLEEDLVVPGVVAPTLEHIVAAEGLKRESPRATLAAIEAFFARDFSYSLNAAGKDGGGRTLADFLTRDRSGHCEYFATATTLLLRKAGIPARYTVGYSVQEWSPFERAFLVRNRHSHAWTSAMIDGRWITVDTTPARWAEDEGEAARGIFGPLLDFFSWLGDRVVQWWLEASFAEVLRDLAIAAGLAALGWGAFFLHGKRRRLGAGAAPRRNRAGAALARLERKLAALGFARHAGETPREWARRVAATDPKLPWGAAMRDLIEAYYRVRFDPLSAPGDGERFVAAADAFRRKVATGRT